MNQKHGQETNSPSWCQDQASRIRTEQKRCDDFDHTSSGRKSGSASNGTGSQSQRTNRTASQGGDFPTGGEIVGGTFSQLIEDCKALIAGNDRIIDSLRETNESLQEKIDSYQRILDRLQPPQEG